MRIAMFTKDGVFISQATLQPDVVGLPEVVLFSGGYYKRDSTRDGSSGPAYSSASYTPEPGENVLKVYGVRMD